MLRDNRTAQVAVVPLHKSPSLFADVRNPAEQLIGGACAPQTRVSSKSL